MIEGKCVLCPLNIKAQSLILIYRTCTSFTVSLSQHEVKKNCCVYFKSKGLEPLVWVKTMHAQLIKDPCNDLLSS